MIINHELAKKFYQYLPKLNKNVKILADLDRKFISTLLHRDNLILNLLNMG